MFPYLYKWAGKLDRVWPNFKQKNVKNSLWVRYINWGLISHAYASVHSHRPNTRDQLLQWTVSNY